MTHVKLETGSIVRGVKKDDCAAVPVQCADMNKRAPVKFWQKSWRTTVLVPEFSPRQFEYNPSTTHRHLLCFGTVEGEVVLFNHDDRTCCFKDRSLCSSGPGRRDSVLGLCWFNRTPNRFVAASENGMMCIYSFEEGAKSPASTTPTAGDDSKLPNGCLRMREAKTPVEYKAKMFTQSSPELTAVHIDCLDERVVTSGHGLDVKVYDFATGALQRTLKRAHEKLINISRYTQTRNLTEALICDRTTCDSF